MTKPSRAGLALIALLAVSVVWGSSFPLTKVLLEELSAQQYLSLRFVIAAVVLSAVFPRAVRRLPRIVVIRGLGLGVLYGLAQLVQTTGLEHTPATVSGFITGMYVVLTPICGALLVHSVIGRRAWIGAVVATVGLAVLALNGLSLGYGEWLTLISALLFALHIVGLSAWATPREALGIAVVQMVGIAGISVIATVPEGFKTPSSASGWLMVLYLALISGALAMIVQSWAQSLLAASRAAIIMSTEPVWAAAFSITFLAEPLTWRVLVGGGLMLAAMLIVELGPRRHPAAEEPPHPEDLPKIAA